jgi:hypothetical protein
MILSDQMVKEVSFFSGGGGGDRERERKKKEKEKRASK